MMTPQHFAAYAATAILFGILDFLWLGRMVPTVYRAEIGDLLLRGVRWGPALTFYFLYILGIVIFAIHPALANGKWMTALVMGALFGFFCYMTWNLTNHSVMRIWSTKISIIDTLWGTFATGTAAAGATWLVLHFLPKGG
jgi:uncharacterized membrane protein